MSNLIFEYNKKIAVHPGYYIKELIEDSEMTQEEFAKRLGTTPKTISKLVNGKTPLSSDLAIKLSIMLGTSVEMWSNLQNTYTNLVNECGKNQQLEEQKGILSSIDYNFFVSIGLVEKVKNALQKIENLCRIFKVTNLEEFRESDILLNCRNATSNFKEENFINARLWVESAIKISENIEVEKFNKEKLLEYIPKIKELITASKDEIVPRLKQIFTECGVIFVIMPPLKNSNINGAVKWINNEKVILVMNGNKMSDIFWFSLFHEIKHILQEKIKLILIASNVNSTEISDEFERELELEADNFARESLIPTKEFDSFTEEYNFSKESIILFSQNQKVSPGIVIGRLQKEGLLPYKTTLNSLKDRYEFEFDRLK